MGGLLNAICKKHSRTSPSEVYVQKQQFKAAADNFLQNATSMQKPSDSERLFVNAVQNSDGSKYNLKIRRALHYRFISSSGQFGVYGDDYRANVLTVVDSANNAVDWEGIMCLGDFDVTAEHAYVRKSDIKEILYIGKDMTSSDDPGKSSWYMYNGSNYLHVNATVASGAADGEVVYTDKAVYLRVKIPKEGIPVMTKTPSYECLISFGTLNSSLLSKYNILKSAWTNM